MNLSRREMIREYIEARGEAGIAELSRLCPEYSAMTLWRDLKALEAEGTILRTRGGAVARKELNSPTELLFIRRAKEMVDEKRRIAKKALAFIEPGKSLFFDSGTTITALAKLLPDNNYNIITCGANIALELIRLRNSNIVLAGGQINSNTLSCSGSLSEKVLDEVNIDTAIMATSGYTPKNGFTSGSITECELKAKVIKKAARVIMLMDLSKLGRSLPFTFAQFSDIDVLILDSMPPGDILEMIEQTGVLLECALRSE